ncbi:VapA/VapB family virulence-associated protein [Salmonella enterica]|nr:VapA/VapB family virulence-associated protein [Escherichia coli O21:H28]EEZ5806508.1 VapA/VapB family virulence-associated protein [Escherichia coli O105]EFN9826748.1 VapA/VapB family virulence-associated protein [Escherichia coli]EIK5743940.1 VapA/VapB family virulence-associated protein [Salmonella enterica]EFS5605374.1 VapA/VapB family virulence-associated protein [Escherichia coli]
MVTTMKQCSNLRSSIMDDVKAKYGEYLPKDQVSQILDKIASAENKYSAKTTLASAIFYIKVDTQITSEGGKHFSGNAGGLSSPGGGVLFGDLYTNDLEMLYKNTVSFQITMTPVFCSVLFFDSSSNLLGHFEGGGVSTISGVAGGTGSWS